MNKPTDTNEFLCQFVSDLKKLFDECLHIDSRVVPVKIGAFICDAPAKTLVLGIVGHTGYYSCTESVREGEYVNARTYFPNLGASPKTDSSFRRTAKEEHHASSSIPLELPFDIVRGVPLGYMQLICLGLMRKLLTPWFKGSKRIKLGTNVREDISYGNVKLARFVPCEFNRKPRSLAHLDI